MIRVNFDPHRHRSRRVVRLQNSLHKIAVEYSFIFSLNVLKDYKADVMTMNGEGRDLTSEGELPLTHRFGYQPKGNVGGFAKSEARSSILSNQVSQLTDSCFFIIRSQYAEGELAWEFGTYFLLDQFEGLDKSWVQSQQQRT